MGKQPGFSQIVMMILGLAILSAGGGIFLYFKKGAPAWTTPTPPITNTNPRPSDNKITAPESPLSPATELVANQPVKPGSTFLTPSPSVTDTPAYTLTAYTGEVFGAKVPRGWQVTSNQSGIDIIDPADTDTGVSGVVAVGWFGTQTPDGFIDFLLRSIGASNVKTENASAEATYRDPSTGLPWVVKTRTFTF
mgnify:FL=1